MRRLALAVAAILYLALPVEGMANDEECAGKYFAPDGDGAHALKRPHAEFAKTMLAARGGDATAQRSLAVFYETGYLVSRCEAKAVRWYAKAALAGDDIAKAWIKRHEQFARLRAGPECVGQQCFGAGSAESRMATFVAGRNGHYFAPVTINGVTSTGLIDTGASTIAMSEETARRFGIDFQFGKKGIASTANGKITSTQLTVPVVTVGGIALRDVEVSVGITGDMLIGMSFLSRLNVRMEAGQLTMSK